MPLILNNPSTVVTGTGPKTFLELTNSVLQRLRESVVTSVTQTDYSTLIGIFVNEAKREVEDAWNWDSLSTSVTIPMVVGQRNYNLTGSHSRTRVLEAYNTTRRWRMQQAPTNQYINNLLALTVTQNASPYVYDIFNYDTATGEMVFRVNPVPTEADSLIFYLVNPQEDLTTDADILYVPKDPVIQLAYLKAINERGEDAGRASEIQEKIYRSTLAEAISQDDIHSSGNSLWQAV